MVTEMMAKDIFFWFPERSEIICLLWLTALFSPICQYRKNTVDLDRKILFSFSLRCTLGLFCPHAWIQSVSFDLACFCKSLPRPLRSHRSLSFFSSLNPLCFPMYSMKFFFLLVLLLNLMF